MAEYQIHLTGDADGELGTLLTTEDEERCHITFRYRDRVIEAEESDYFEAFCQIRLELEKEGIIPFCYGASLNVYPSGMGRDMGAGLKAYKMEMGRHARIKDLVEIFGVGPDIKPASVQSQREFWEEWLATPRV